MSTIHQAVFGDINGGYGLLRSTCDVELAKRISGYTDLHEQTPDGINWDNVLRGFSIENYYLLMRTFVDKSPNIRDGRVYSHCLIIALADLNEINNLQELVKCLPINFRKDSAIEVLKLENDSYGDSSTTLRTNFLINTILQCESELIAWIDYEGYEQAICTVWNNIVPSLRRSLRFGLAFNFQESANMPGLKIFSVPSNFIIKWQQNGVPIISPGDKGQLLTDAAKSMGGERSQGGLKDFIISYSIVLNNISDYLTMQKIFNTKNDIESKGLNELLTFLNTLLAYGIKPSPADLLMEKISEAIAGYIKRGGVEEIIRVRNENLREFVPANLFRAIVIEIKEKVLKIAGESANNTVLLFSYLIRNNIQEWWRDSVFNGLNSFFQSINGSSVQTLLKLLERYNSVDIGIFDRLLPADFDEKALLRELKTGVDYNDYSQLESLAIKRKWFDTVSLVLTRTKKIGDAFKILYSADPNCRSISAYQVLIEDYPFKEVLKTAEKVKKMFFTDLLADHLLKNTASFSEVDFRKAYPQELLLALLDKGWDFLSYPDYKAVLFEILDQVSLGNTYNQKLLYNIVRNPMCEILDYPKRNNIWQLVKPEVKEVLLINSSSALLERLSINSTTSIPADPILETYIMETGVSKFLYYNRNNIRSVIPIYERFALSDLSLRHYLDNYSGNINVVEAKQLGVLIAAKGFTDSAYAINGKSGKNSPWKFALVECYQLLDIFSIGYLKVSGILSSVTVSEDDWWTAVQELIIELYPNGPSLTTLWKKSGGKESDIMMNSNADSAWHDLLHRLRHQSFKKININKLLKEVEKQYGENVKFQYIVGLKKNFAKS